MRFLEHCLAQPWAMTSEDARGFIEIAGRDHEIDPKALEAYRSEYADRGERLRARDGVGIIYADGPMFKRANLFVAVSGATAYEIIARDLQAAIDDPELRAIMLMLDTPGGEVRGLDQLAASIFEARKKKRIEAYVSGSALSAGYWMAAATQKITISEASAVGSIGVVMATSSTKERDEKNGVKNFEFVSSQSPNKRPDPDTKEGANQIQKTVDDLGAVFVSAIAKYRGVSEETVIEKFGAGGVEIGANAVELGMADEVGQFETALAALSQRGSRRTQTRSNNGGLQMSDQTESAAAETETSAASQAPAVDVAKVQQDAETNAQARMKSILAGEDAKSLPTLANHLAFDTSVSASDAEAILKAAKADFDSASEEAAAAAEAAASVQEEDSQASFEAQKAEDGALGLAKPEERRHPSQGNNAQEADHGWGASAKRVNQRATGNSPRMSRNAHRAA